MKDVKQVVKDKYGQIARQNGGSSCCGSKDATELAYSVMADDYTGLKGYAQDADLSLGCGLPTQFAMIMPGQTVVDLGSGAGNDCFVARAETGENGRVIGVDFTPDMLAKARENAKKLGYTNVEFVEGDIENLPLEDNLADVIVSNCVLNLVPDKVKAFSETYRVLQPGGHISVSDIVLEGDLPEGLKHDAAMYAGCVASAIQMKDYLAMVQEAGFIDMRIQKKKPIVLPEELLDQYLDADAKARFNKDQGIYSITLFARKAAESCCGG